LGDLLKNWEMKVYRMNFL